MMTKYYLLLLCFGAAFNATATENATFELTSLQEKVNRAIIKIEDTKRELWSYQVSRYEDEEGDISSSIEQHSPHASERWTLKQINGQAPTKKQIKRFAKDKNSTKKQAKSMQLSLRELINHDSLSLISKDDKQIVMGFNVHLNKLGKDSIGKLQGKLIFKRDEQFIEKILIWNNAEFSPMFTANITDLAITLTFLQIKGAVLFKQNELKMKGSFAYFTEIDETSLDIYSDYLYQGKPRT